jgi:hypothetical protein
MILSTTLTVHLYCGIGQLAGRQDLRSIGDLITIVAAA